LGSVPQQQHEHGQEQEGAGAGAAGAAETPLWWYCKRTRRDRNNAVFGTCGTAPDHVGRAAVPVASHPFNEAPLL
jgi:hypothetical protein